jgi:hypothetical protein
MIRITAANTVQPCVRCARAVDDIGNPSRRTAATGEGRGAMAPRFPGRRAVDLTPTG